MTRAEKRNALETFNACVELWKIIRHFFPDLISLLRQGKDHRHKSYITYENHVLLFVRILAVIFRIESMRKITDELNHSICIKNSRKILGIEEMEELPHWKTINDYLEKLEPSILEEIIPKLVTRLTRMRTFENSRIRNKYWHIVVDATQLYSFSERHCEHCLERKFKDSEGNIIRKEYYHVVLEAKIVLNGNIAISICTEFVENESPDVTKQDCELNAFYRMAKKLKKRFPRLPICLGMDSLYACAPVFNLCTDNNWKYIIRFKDGSIKTVAEEFHTLKHMDIANTWTKRAGEVEATYRFVTNIAYQSHELNIAEYTQSDKKYPFVFITNLPITKRNCEQLVIDGRNRWRIENEGFNEQKNHGFGLTHMFSQTYNAIKNHYFLIQIGHMIAQLFEAGIRLLKSLGKISTTQIFANLKTSFQTITLDNTHLDEAQRRTQFRFQ